MSLRSTPQPAVLVIMTEQEKHEFMPPDLESRLSGLIPDLARVEAPLQDVEWRELLRD